MKIENIDQSRLFRLAETRLPQPTYAPAAMALGVMMLLWGIVTMWIMAAAGAGLMAWSLATWIKEIVRS